MEETGADFACGPVVPDYAALPPCWVRQGEFFNTSTNSLGTSNLILRVTNVARHVDAETAVVRESVAQSRMRPRYAWRRGFRNGVVIAQIAWLRSTSRTSFVAKVLRRTGAKLGYG